MLYNVGELVGCGNSYRIHVGTNHNVCRLFMQFAQLVCLSKSLAFHRMSVCTWAIVLKNAAPLRKQKKRSQRGAEYLQTKDEMLEIVLEIVIARVKS